MTETTTFPYKLRTEESILERVRQCDNFLGFDKEVLVPYLPFSLANQFLVEGAKEEDWQPVANEVEAIFKEALDYLTFAYGKAQNHRGISASRSVDKMTEYCWLLGDDEDVVGNADWGQYGVGRLFAAAKFLGQPTPDDEDLKRMAKGLPCVDDCWDGCS